MKNILPVFIAIFLFAVNVKASVVDTLFVSSNCMNKSIPNLVILPDSYEMQKEAFPVVYLLPGAGGDFKTWLEKVPRLEAYVDQYNFIIVCPSGGYTSWYFDSPIDQTMKYETYISEELIEAIDKEFKTLDNRDGRAITGLSMGGHGAFYLAFRHQEIWAAAGSTSGGLDIRPFPTRWEISKRLGSYAENKKNWEENTVINMVYLLEGTNLKLIFDCGTGDFFYDANKRMHEKLIERNIPHDYIERPGRHDNAYWQNSIKYQLLYFHEFFESTTN